MNSFEKYVHKQVNKIHSNKKMDIDKRVHFADTSTVVFYEITKEEINMKREAFRNIQIERMLENITKQIKYLTLEPRR